MVFLAPTVTNMLFVTQFRLCDNNHVHSLVTCISSNPCRWHRSTSHEGSPLSAMRHSYYNCLCWHSLASRVKHRMGQDDGKQKNDTRRQPDTSWKPSPQMPGSFRNCWETRGSENVRNMAFTRIILHRFLCYRTFPCHGSWLQMADIIWFRIFIKIYNKISFQCFNWAWCPVERNKQLIIINS